MSNQFALILYLFAISELQNGFAHMRYQFIGIDEHYILV